MDSVSSAKGNLTATRTTKMAIKAEVIQISRMARLSFNLTGRTRVEGPHEFIHSLRDFYALLQDRPSIHSGSHNVLKATKDGRI